MYLPVMCIERTYTYKLYNNTVAMLSMFIWIMDELYRFCIFYTEILNITVLILLVSIILERD